MSLRLLAPALFVAAVVSVPREHLPLLLPFLVLAAVACALRVPFDGTSLDLEAAAIFPAVILTRTWEAGALLAPAAVLAARFAEGRGRLNRTDLNDAADLVFAYGAASFFYVSLSSAAGGSLAAVLLYAATLLVFFFARVVLGSLHATADPARPDPSPIRAVAYQLFALLLLSPFVALAVILHPTHGFPGVVLAFTSVALVSASLRNLARARHRTAELARQNRELETLRKISALFSGAARDEDVFERLFRALQGALSFQAMAAVSYEDDPDGRAFVALKGEVAIERRAFLDWLARQRDMESPFLSSTPVPKVATGPTRELALNARLPFQVLLPLQTTELIAGLLVLESEDAGLVEPVALQQLSVLADHVALSLQDRNLRRQMQAVNDRLQGRAETLHRILEVSNELKSHLTLDHVLVNIVRAVANSLGFNVVLLSLYDRNEAVFERRAHVGLDAVWEDLSRQRPPREEIARWFAERFRISKSYFISHLDRIEPEDITGRLDRRRRATGAGAWHPQDLLFIPLTAGDHLIGVLQVDDPKSGRVPKLEDVQALEIFANQAVTAIQSARAYETTRLASVRDSLTEAFNHRYFQETLYREMTRHERSGQTLALVMLDIDDFKKINDRWGHPVGDLVLRGLVEELLKGVREMDTVARYGGEEFAVILPETTPEKAFVVADRLRARVSARLFVSPETSHPLSVTISAGLACFPDDANSKRALIERADQALYQAKRSGKNCVVTASSLTDLQVL